MNAKKSANDLVQIYAHRICYSLGKSRIWDASRQDFEVLELDQRAQKEAPVDLIRVQFSSRLSKEDAIRLLRGFAEDLEEEELPAAVVKVPRESAAQVIVAQKLCAELLACMPTLPLSLRAWWLSVLGDAVAEGIEDYLAQAPSELLDSFIKGGAR
jgi:hypothetical protein